MKRGNILGINKTNLTGNPKVISYRNMTSQFVKYSKTSNSCSNMFSQYKLNDVINEIKKSYLFKEKGNNNIKRTSEILLNSPYISQDMKNKYSSLYLEAINDFRIPLSKKKDGSEFFNNQGRTRENENISHKKRELISILTDGTGTNYEDVKKLRQFSFRPKNSNKIKEAKIQFERMLNDTPSEKMIYNTKPKIRYYHCLHKRLDGISLLQDKEKEINEYMSHFSSSPKNIKNSFHKKSLSSF